MKLRALAAALAAASMSGEALAAAGPGTGSNTFQCAPYQVTGGGSYVGQ